MPALADAGQVGRGHCQPEFDVDCLSRVAWSCPVCAVLFEGFATEHCHETAAGRVQNDVPAVARSRCSGMADTGNMSLPQIPGEARAAVGG